MACWSAENAIKAYLRTLKMGKRDEDQGLDIAEFISALAAGNNARLMVVACAGAADSTTLALVAAAHQTGGRVVCILPGPDQLRPSKEALGSNASHVEFVIGEAQNLLSNDYLEADFAVIDCNLGNHEDIIRAMSTGRKTNGCIVVGYNAFCSGSWQWSGLMRVQLLPIGGGLLVTRIPANEKVKNGSSGCGKSHWVVKVDKCTGEEHVFRVRSPHGKR
ncbi:hypothetical protein RHGRI_027786 [Rhododendron griersonianum]|uniref:S-adenosyl-L-methionine-dependent methyltransferase n=1 Tax=Rhododendron griersonianum TaxID=479676 RepID=A0AAV6J2F7_9ERIC|nr:hypothetical protein RHGRI_027786 [Rhododendron griersonianum]